jgi:hypothetical protein
MPSARPDNGRKGAAAGAARLSDARRQPRQGRHRGGWVMAQVDVAGAVLPSR